MAEDKDKIRAKLEREKQIAQQAKQHQAKTAEANKASAKVVENHKPDVKKQSDQTRKQQQQNQHAVGWQQQAPSGSWTNQIKQERPLSQGEYGKFISGERQKQGRVLPAERQKESSHVKRLQADRIAQQKHRAKQQQQEKKPRGR